MASCADKVGEKMADVSVIIPAYNAAKTVERTIRSVLASTIPVDVFVVDDGSTDGTGELLDRMEKELASANGARLVVMHQPNCGAYQARLNALKKIETPYFGFVDADDEVDPKMYEKMLAAMERGRLDAVQCGYVLSHVDIEKGWPCRGGDGENVDSRVERVERVDGEGSLTTLEGNALTKYKFGYLVNPKVSCFIWDKLYRNQYDFDSFEETDRVTNFDDMIFNFQFFRKINRLGFLDEKLYNYIQTEGSAVHSFGPRQKHDFKWMVDNHYRLSRELFPNGEYGRCRLWLGHLHWYAINLRSSMISRVRSWIRR